MFIPRDMSERLRQSSALIQIIWGPRQCGKSTLLGSLLDPAEGGKVREITFDDWQMREWANQDPGAFLDQFPPPLLLDEIQYVPRLFPELKKRVDDLKRRQLFASEKPVKRSPLFRLTGSNAILLDKAVKESLAGRASFYRLNTLSVHEIQAALPNMGIQDILFKGGWPELYSSEALSIPQFLNDYIQSYIEKDIVMSAGIQKTAQFLTVLRLCAARTGQEADYTTIHKDSGVSSVTVKDWVGLLERADLIYALKPYFNNLNKRLIKRSKLYFLDTGLAARLQGWSECVPLLNSPQIGSLFETLAVGEMVKFIRNYGKDWELFFWRTKDGQEVDVLIKTETGQIHAFEMKYAIHGWSKPVSYPPAFEKEFQPTTPLVVVTSGGLPLQLSAKCTVLPIAHLHDYLKAL